MDYAERDEIVDQVLIRMCELSDGDKKARAIMNRKVLLDASKEQSERMRKLFNDHPYANGRNYVDYPHVWRAIHEINKLVPWIIGVRYSNQENEDAFYEAHPPVTNADIRTHMYSVPNPLLMADKKLAEQISRELTDILFKYMEPGAWDENN